jgi:hypothetical protein
MIAHFSAMLRLIYLLFQLKGAKEILLMLFVNTIFVLDFVLANFDLVTIRDLILVVI